MLEKNDIKAQIDCFLSNIFSTKIELRTQNLLLIHLYHLTAVIFNDLSFVHLKNLEQFKLVFGLLIISLLKGKKHI